MKFLILNTKNFIAVEFSQVQQRDQLVLQGQVLQQNLEVREVHRRSLIEMEELKKAQSSTFDMKDEHDNGTFWPSRGIVAK